MNRKFHIASMPEDVERPFTNVEPIVDTLIAEGNEIAGPSKFYMDRDGWRCDLRRPIDFDLIERRFELPSSITLARSYDGILDQNTWVKIQGGVEPHGY